MRQSYELHRPVGKGPAGDRAGRTGRGRVHPKGWKIRAADRGGTLGGPVRTSRTAPTPLSQMRHGDTDPSPEGGPVR